MPLLSSPLTVQAALKPHQVPLSYSKEDLRLLMCYDLNMQNPLAPTKQQLSWFYRRLTAHAVVILHFHIRHSTL